MRFLGKTALISGGASGIGAATALRLAAEGARVIVADRDVENGEWVLDQIGECGGRGFFQQVDLADRASIRRCAAAVSRAVPALHVLVNSAGIVRRGTVAETGDEDWQPQVAVNLHAPALMAQALLPLMKAEGGAIVNLSSEGAFRPRADHWVYDATKAGICALTRSMAVEFHPYGIRVNAVAPGWIVTEMHFARAADPQARRRELEALEIEQCIMRRLGRPQEIASAIAFLASDEASYITAITLHVDGGQGIG